MAKMYTLIGSPKSRAFRVLWMLEELELDYQLEPAAPRSEAALAVNPSGKIPALKVGDDVIIDSAAICQYLADRHGRFTHPAGSIERALQDSWLHFALDEVDSTLWYNAKHTFVLPAELRSEATREACKYDFDRAMQFLERRLGAGPYVMGEDFTVPDILLGHCAGWAVNGAGWEIPRGPVADYVARVRSRPACQRALEIRERH